MPELRIEGVLETQHAIGSGINGVVFVMMYGLDHPCGLSNGFQLTLTCDESVWFECKEARTGTRLVKVWVEDPRTRRGFYDMRDEKYTYYVQAKYSDKSNVFTRTYTVCAHADLTPGENKFPFQIPLSNDMPPSFNLAFNKAKGGVTYSLKAEYLDPMTGNTISSEEVQNLKILSSVLKSDFIQKLDVPKELGKDSVALEPRTCDGGPCCFSGERKIDVSVSVCPQIVFVPAARLEDMPPKGIRVGDKYSVVAAPAPNRSLAVGIRIDNQGDEPISNFELIVTQDIHLNVKHGNWTSSEDLHKLKITLEKDKVVQPHTDRLIILTLSFPLDMNIGDARSSSPKSYFPTFVKKLIKIQNGVRIGFKTMNRVEGNVHQPNAFQFVGAIDESEFNSVQGVVLESK